MADGDPTAIFRPKWLSQLWSRGVRRFFQATRQRRQILSTGPIDAAQRDPDPNELRHYVRTVRVRPRPRVVPIGGGTFVFRRNQALATDSSLTSGLSTHPL